MKKNGRLYQLVLLMLVLLLTATGSDCPAAGGKGKISWNDSGIHWYDYEEGLAKAKRENKPAILILYSHSCSTCRNYSRRVLHQPSIADAAAAFVMIRVNTAERRKLANAYRFDGGYVPKTFALYPDGRIMQQLHPPKKYRYFIGLNPQNLLGLMRNAQAQMQR
ncbi:MAG: thioredoxin family protein [Candidatus Electrothrix sp. YB6]